MPVRTAEPRVRGPSRAVRLGRAVHRRLLHPLLDFVLPTDCLVCDRILDPSHRHGVCSDCWAAFRLVSRPACPGCGEGVGEATDLLGPARGRCAACLAAPDDRLDGVRAVVVYDELARRVLLAAKLGRRRELLRAIAELLAADLRASGFARGRPTLIPVPSHPWAALRRGFSPGALLALGVGRALRLPLMRWGLGRRWFPLGTAKRLPRGRRLELASAAFVWRRARVPRRVLLIDDVMTTGATLRACAATLKSAGALEVRAAVWARTPGFGLDR